MTELLQPKDSLVKLLLSTPSQIHANLTLPTVYKQTENGSDDIDVEDDGINRLINYFEQNSTNEEKKSDVVMMDHSYCRPWNWRPETSFMRPTKCLFVWRSGSSATSKNGVVDVSSCTTAEPAPVYDVDKARALMEESEKIVASIKPNADDNCEDWENKLPRATWTTTQNTLFTNMIKILDEDRLGRLTYEGSWNEPVLRRNVIDKSVSRARSLFAGTSWDAKLTQWLHGALLDHLPRSYLIAYVDLLQSLRAKLPALVDRMVWGRGVLLRRPWEPGAPLARARPPPQLPPPQPVWVISACGGPRAHRWAALLAQLGPVVQAQLPGPAPAATETLPAAADRALAAVRARLVEARQNNPDRPIVLVGAGAGAAFALQAADAERVACCICLGPALLTTEGRRGDPDDTALLDAQCPVLFVVGQCAHRCSRELAEDIRQRMRVRTGLVVVGSADDHLRMAKSRRRRHGVTQAIVDRCVLDEIADFVGEILSAPPPPAQSAQPGQQPQQQAGIAVSLPPPPPVKISRPVGRPPGSGRKKQLLPPPQVLQRPRHHMPPPPTYPDCLPPPPPPWYLHPHRHPTPHKHRKHMHMAAIQQQRASPVSSGPLVIPGREQRTTVKVLEGATHGRRTVDLSKVTLVNSTTTHVQQPSTQSQQHSVLVLADGTRCLRPTQPTVTRLVPTRRHVTTNVRPTLQQPQLTPSEILDLPIIFADGDSPLLTETAEEPIEPPHHKYVLINKHSMQSQVLKRPATSQVITQPKYARIIINNQQSNQQSIVNQSQQVQLEFVDLETELKTNTVPKPLHLTLNEND